MDYFSQSGDESRLKNANLADDMDLLQSRHHIGPWGPELVATAMRAGAHVCWYCFELFEDRGKRAPIEVRHGFVLVLLHRACVGKKPRSFQTVFDIARGHQLRREATRIVKGSAALDDVVEGSASPLSLNTDLFASARKLLERDSKSAVPETESTEEEPLIQLAGGLDALTSRESGGDNATE